MRCEVNINDQNVITNAVSCGTMFRGLEIILQGRDPRDAWAFVERDLRRLYWRTRPGFRFTPSKMPSVLKVPDNANIIRNIMLATLWCHDHLVHFISLPGWIGSMC